MRQALLVLLASSLAVLTHGLTRRAELINTSRLQLVDDDHSPSSEAEEETTCHRLSSLVHYPDVVRAFSRFHNNGSSAVLCQATKSGAVLQSTTSQPQPDIIFWHLEKAAGTSVINYLTHSTGTRIHIISEQQHLRAAHWDAKHFRIGVIPEPCSYYNSLYHWGAAPWRTGHGWTSRHLVNEGLGERFYGTPTKEKFHDWLRHVNGDGLNTTCGLLSMRLWTQVVSPTGMDELNKFYNQEQTNMCRTSPHRQHFMKPCPAPLGDFSRGAPEDFHARCSRDLREFDFSKFDCWLRTDHLSSDFGECMEKFEKRGGILKQRWNPQEATHYNTYEHQSCEDMHDSDSAALVNRMDGDLMRRFGFSGKCCGVHPGTSMPVP